MAPHPDDPTKPIWWTPSQASGSAATPAADENAHHAQQPSLGPIRGAPASSYQSTSSSSRPSPQVGQASSNTVSSMFQAYNNNSSAVPRQANTSKRKAMTKESPGQSSKAPRSGSGRPSGTQSVIGSNRSIPRDNPPSPSGSSDPGGPSEVALDSDFRPSEKPPCSLREIIWAMICKSSQLGLRLYLKASRQHYIRVGTLCSGTDAPVHVMHLFSMFKDSAGKPVFETLNVFGCEIEPWKQSFLMRNSKPGLLFKDARDFAQGDAQRARLVTGAEVDIPSVDFFIAGTSCVDFSTLSSTKRRDYAGLSHALDEWKKMKAKHGDKLSFQHLSDDDWRAAIGAMSEETETKNTSTKTFAAAMNYVKFRQPKIVVFENVDSAPWQKLIERGTFQLMGYSATMLRLDTKHYYMPQTRVRKYLIAFSHRAFTLKGAQALCQMFGEILTSLQHTHTNSVTDFILPPNSLELHKARNEMELAALAVREREAGWAFSKARHAAYRRKHNIPELRLWIRWTENGIANSPVEMPLLWVNRQPLRVLDVLEALYLYALYGRNLLQGPYDMRYKAQIIDCSQNVDRISPDITFGRTGCLTPNAIPVLTLEARPITGTESLRLQGLPVENFDMSVETQAQLQDLAGNAMTTTVVGAVILAALSAVARVAQKDGHDWLQQLFQQGDYEPLGKIPNSFHSHVVSIDHGTQILLHLKLYAHIFPVGLDPPHRAVRAVLELAQRARRRCPCQHILSYSSVELYICKICGASHCKSCKGNPEHALARSQDSLEDLKALPYAQAQFEFRRCFPQMFWMRSSTDALVRSLHNALLTSTCNNTQRGELAKAIIEGLCQSTYQLQFVEITDAVRLEYVADSRFVLRVVIEEDELTWYLHLNRFSATARLLSDILPKGQPIARAVLGQEEQSLFPGARAWEFWIPHKVSFDLVFQVQHQQAICLSKVGDLDGVPEQTRRSIKVLQGTLWNFHPECGFPEDALWVFEGGLQKLFLFKDVDPIGPAREDAFVISKVSRNMGRTASGETRPVLLRIAKQYQIHRNFKNVLLGHGDFLISAGHKFSVQGFIDGWWEGFETHGICFESFPNIEYEGVRSLAKAAPTSIRGPGDLSQAERYQVSCGEFQSLLTTSLPILGKAEESMKTQETLKSLDLTQPLDLAELIKLIGPLYSAVETGLVGTGHRVLVIQENVGLISDCFSCAPKIPEVFYVKSAADKAGGFRTTGPAVARHRALDQQNYQLSLQSKPPLLHIDHNLTAPFDNWNLKKDGFNYIDVRFLAHGHALLHQARAYLPTHPCHYKDSTETTGTFAMEVAVIENPRLVLPPPTISAPEPVALENARLPSGFQNGLQLFKEQSDSLQWMLQRESVEDPEPFIETETAEVYKEKLGLRVYADAQRPVYRRGRVVADSVGFGKTAVCLALIDVQRDTDRNDFMGMRAENDALNGLVHLHATLIIVPNHLTHQWAGETKRFLGAQYKVLVIQTFATLQSLDIAALKGADIIICSNKVFQDNKYHSELSRYCSTNDIDKIQTLQKVYRAWYKQFQSIFQQVRGDVVRILEQGNKTLARQQQAALLHKLDQIRSELQELDDDEQLSFAPPNSKDSKVKQARGKAADGAPQLLLENFSYARIICDEFPYQDNAVTEFVANCAANAKWMLSGTPPMSTLADAVKIAYLFSVHVAREVQLIKGRQPPICDNEPLAPHSDLEATSLFQSRHSPNLLKERHAQLEAFVRSYMRRNHRETNVAKFETPIVLTISNLGYMFYVELQAELRSRQYNANNVGSEGRRRLMSLVPWKGNQSGRDRSVEALNIRASSSTDDVLRPLGLDKRSDLEAARFLLSITEAEIENMEDRGRELFGKSIFLAHRLTYITLSDTKDELDGQDERQLDYYQNLVDIVESVLTIDMKTFQSWDAFMSAVCMLFWDEQTCYEISDYKPFANAHAHELAKTIRELFDCLRLCQPPKSQPKWPQEKELRKTKVRNNFESKKAFFELFRDWVTKTPLHSRRWYLLDKVSKLDASEEELLRLEWRQKRQWERVYNDSAQSHSHMVVPIYELRNPAHFAPSKDSPSAQSKDSPSAQPEETPSAQLDDFDFEYVKALDRSRRDTLSEMESLSDEAAADLMKEFPDCKDNKAFWEEECNRRGLVVKSLDKKEVLMARVNRNMNEIAADKDYTSPDSCGIALTDFPQQGKKKIRGGHMEVIFDELMQAIDGLTSLLERCVVMHAKRNIQKLTVELLDGSWVCEENLGCCKKYPNCKCPPKCTVSPEEHYLSLLCGHVFCAPPDDSQPCGVALCQRSVKDVCIPFSKITKTERVVAASSLSGAINQDPDPYLDSESVHKGTTRSPKARAVVNLIKRIDNRDQVVVFVQNATMATNIYNELDAAHITHVTARMLSDCEAPTLEGFKNGRYKVLVQTINSEQAAGSNLHNANHVIFVSPLMSRQQTDWDAQMEQALGRCVRFRQSKKVYVYHTVMDETIEVDTLEWRKKKEVIVTDGEAVGCFSDCTAKDFLARYEGDESATKLEMAPWQGRAHSILPREDIQYLMGDDMLSLTAIKALKTIDESMAEPGNQAQDEDAIDYGTYIQEVEDENQDVAMEDAEDIYRE